MFNFDHHKNLAGSIIATAPSPATTGTTLTVSSGDGASFPAPPFNCLVYPSNVSPNTLNSEIVRVTGISIDTFTIVRAREGSSNRNIIVSDVISVVVTAQSLTDIETAVNTVQSSVDTLTTNSAPISNPTFVGATTAPKSKVADGLVSAPSYTFINDLTTGIYRGDNKVQVAVSGVSQLQISSGGISSSNVIADTAWFPTSLVVGGLSLTTYLTNDGNFRMKDGKVELFDPAYALSIPTSPWCAISVLRGVISTSTPLPNGTLGVGTVTSLAFITADRRVRIKDGFIQFYDDAYALANSSNPWCALMVNNGVLSTSAALFDDTMPDGTITTALLTTSDGQIRIKDGLLQLWDEGYHIDTPGTPWCGIYTNNGILATTAPIAM